MKKQLIGSLVALACVGALAPVASAVEDQNSGTVAIASKSVAVGVGVTWGDGTLVYQGKTHHFTVNGLTVVDLGVSAIHTSGEVSKLTKLADFSGHYVAGAAGIAAGDGVNDYIMTNDHGVVLRLHGTEKGVRLQAGAGGVNINVKD